MPELGRPPKYQKKYCDMLVKHMASGLSYETFAAVIDVDRSTLYAWEKNNKKYPGFSDAKRKGFEQCQLFWEKLGVGGTAGKVKNFSSGTWVYNMKCRFRKDWMEPTMAKKEEDRPLEVKVKIAYDPEDED